MLPAMSGPRRRPRVRLSLAGADWLAAPHWKKLPYMERALVTRLDSRHLRSRPPIEATRPQHHTQCLEYRGCGGSRPCKQQLRPRAPPIGPPWPPAPPSRRRPACTARTRNGSAASSGRARPPGPRTPTRSAWSPRTSPTCPRRPATDRHKPTTPPRPSRSPAWCCPRAAPRPSPRRSCSRWTRRTSPRRSSRASTRSSRSRRGGSSPATGARRAGSAASLPRGSRTRPSLSCTCGEPLSRPSLCSRPVCSTSGRPRRGLLAGGPGSTRLLRWRLWFRTARPRSRATCQPLPNG